ncbi:MAG: UDP-N-acetylmuramoyl-tripeptide--D-alanyl-D-alanine ligase [Cyanobacteria bacterium]|nr:UDP-N-acetylmuramoyl-tripeptide--D-alanyl-D-alanine ligase [Cyanobacteriota bacterium]
MTPFAATFSGADIIKALVLPESFLESLSSVEAARVETDTRNLSPGAIFVCLKGERFDGHDYVLKAFEQGVALVVVDEGYLLKHPEWEPMRAQIVAVPNTVEALLALARYHRRRSKATVVAVTGSSGKTTTKEMIQAGLSPLAKTQCSFKNHNNEIGVAQTLLGLQPDTEILIVEMGMRGLHQIELLTKYAEPDVAVVVNVGPAHIGLLGSLDAIATAKCEIFSGLNPKTGIAIVNGDDALLCQTAKKGWGKPLKQFSLGQASQIVPTEKGGMGFVYQNTHFEIPLPGEHMVSNALAAIAVGEACGYSPKDIARGLATVHSAEGRWSLLLANETLNTWVIHDAYNANPASVKASLNVFLRDSFWGQAKQTPPQKMVILGGMNELGNHSEAYHRQLGSWLAAQPNLLDLLVLLGQESQWVLEGVLEGVNTVSQNPIPMTCLKNAETQTPEALFQEFLNVCLEHNLSLANTVVLLKASRTYQLENWIPFFKGAQH